MVAGSASASESEPVSAAAPASVAATATAPVLVTPVQGSESLRAERQERVADAVGRALEARGYSVAVSQEILSQAVVACQSPECVEQALDAAGAEFAIVPAIWLQESGDMELTLTLVQRLGRNLNASGPVGEDLSAAASTLVGDLLAQRAASVPVRASAPEPAPAPKHPHAWKAGPIILIAGGAAAFIAIGVGAATKRDNQQLNTTAVAVWSAVGAAAVAGGIAWWVVGSKRRRKAPTVGLHPSGIDLRLRF